ncbi:hypothetical protein HDU67_001072 [Dinochytrium kinnereticum]|nr:hypothetical protein HDU67_001072 [Dinochytrium kinnereticum]
MPPFSISTTTPSASMPISPSTTDTCSEPSLSPPPLAASVFSSPSPQSSTLNLRHPSSAKHHRRNLSAFAILQKNPLAVSPFSASTISKPRKRSSALSLRALSGRGGERRVGAAARQHTSTVLPHTATPPPSPSCSQPTSTYPVHASSEYAPHQHHQSIPSSTITTTTTAASTPIPPSLGIHQTVDIAIRILYGILGPQAAAPLLTVPSSQPPEAQHHPSSSRWSGRCDKSVQPRMGSDLHVGHRNDTADTDERMRVEARITTALAHAAILNLPFCKASSGPSHPLLFALLLVYRMVRSPVKPASASSSQSPSRLLLAGLMIAEAQLSDRQTSTAVWAKLYEMALKAANAPRQMFAVVTPREVAAVKREALETVGYYTCVSVPEYSAWLAALRQLLHQSFAVAAAAANNAGGIGGGSGVALAA